MGFKMAVKKSSNCFEYVDASFWDSASESAVGTFVDGVGWSSIDTTDGNVITLIPLGIVPWDSVWTQGYQPKSARITFTGQSTVAFYFLEREEDNPDTLLATQEGYSSGDLITLEGLYSSGTTKLSSVTVAVFVPGTIVVSSVIFCF